MKEEQTIKAKKDNFIIQGFILAIAGILVRIIGLIYRIPLTNIVGEEGMGYYSQAFNIYSITLLLSSYSLPLAVSKMISSKIGKREYINANRIFKVALIYATIVGFIGFCLIYFFSDALSELVFNMPPVSIALKALAPTIWIMAYLGVFRGYFQGHSTMLPTAVSQIIEQVINAIFSIFAARYLSNMAIKQSKNLTIVRAYGACGGTVGTGLGALSALLSLILLFLLVIKILRERNKRDRSISKESYIKLSKILFLTVVPVIASTAIYNINTVIDGAIFGHNVSSLNDFSKTAKDFGVYTSKYLVLVNVPVAIANALSSSLIPELSKAKANRDNKTLRANIALAIRTALLISIPASLGLAILAKPIITLLFGNSPLAVKLMQMGSIVVILYSLSTISNAILQGTNNMSVPVRNTFYALILHIIVLILFLNFLKMGIYALVLANIIFAFLICLFNAISIKKRLRYRQEIFKTYLMPFICSLFMGIIIFIIYIIIDKFIKSNFIACLIPGITAIFVYFYLLIKTGTITERELLFLPKGRIILKILKKYKLI